MATENDQMVLNAILNPNTPFEEEKPQSNESSF